jgi:hypothetical protein
MAYWIKERHNPQLGVYYVPYGELNTKQAKEFESSLYGSNTMLKFKTEKEYREKIESLKAAGEHVHAENLIYSRVK